MVFTEPEKRCQKGAEPQPDQVEGEGGGDISEEGGWGDLMAWEGKRERDMAWEGCRGIGMCRGREVEGYGVGGMQRERDVAWEGCRGRGIWRGRDIEGKVRGT
jgi:hypothetical protein